MTMHDSQDRETTLLDISVFDKDNYRRDDFIGRCEINLWSLEFDKTHSCELNLTDAPGQLLLLVTIHSVQPTDHTISMSELAELQDQYVSF